MSRHIKRVSLAVIAGCFIAGSLCSSQQTATYLLNNFSTKSKGMGNLSLFSDNADLFWNPAGLAFKPGRRMEFASGSTENLGNAPSLRVHLPGRFFSLGLDIWSFSKDVEVFDFFGNQLDNVKFGAELMSLGGALRLGNFAWGFSINNLSDYIDGISGDPSYDASFPNYSLLFRFGKKKRWNMTYGMFNPVQARFDDLDEELISGNTFGLGYHGDKWRFGFQSGAYGEDGETFRGVGIEYKLTPGFMLRAGSFQTGGIYESAGGPNLGLTYGTKRFDFEMAYQNHSYLGDTAQFGVAYHWGAGSPVPAEKPKQAEVKQPVEEVPVTKVSLEEAPAGEKVNVAVLDFESRPPISPAEAAFISDFFRADMVKSPRFALIDKNNMAKIMAEQGFQQTGCSSMECAVQIGKLLNVRYMIMGSCGKLLNKYIITMNVVSVQTAQIVYSDDSSTDNPDMLRDMVKSLVGSFLKSVK